VENATCCDGTGTIQPQPETEMAGQSKKGFYFPLDALSPSMPSQTLLRHRRNKSDRCISQASLRSVQGRPARLSVMYLVIMGLWMATDNPSHRLGILYKKTKNAHGPFCKVDNFSEHESFSISGGRETIERLR
jgi:hypothetical protein